MGKYLFLKIVAVTLFTLSISLVGFYFFMKPISEVEQNATVLVEKPLEKPVKQITYDKNETTKIEKKSVSEEIEEYMEKIKISKINVSTKIEEDKNISIPKQVEKVEKLVKKEIEIIEKKVKKLPKLAIIMDDIGFFEQALKLKEIPFAITPSIFPANINYPNTPKIAKMFKYHMVHFPMEAYNYKNIKEEAIKVSDTLEFVDKKVQRVKQNFPHALAINNHTGSKFTCDLDAMDMFFSVLTKYDIEFIDSKTISDTKCLEAGKLYGRRVLQRDIFLDNIDNYEYIRVQLKKAIKIAKRDGKAIAICHPKDVTFEVLKNSADLFKDVELVYINEFI